MEVHPLLGQLDCLLAGEEAKRGKKIYSLHFIVCFLHFLPRIIFYIFTFFPILQVEVCLTPPGSPLAWGTGQRTCWGVLRWARFYKVRFQITTFFSFFLFKEKCIIRYFQVWYDLPSDVFHTAVSNIDTFLAKMKVRVTNIFLEKICKSKVFWLEIASPECLKIHKSFKFVALHIEFKRERINSVAFWQILYG